MFGIELAPFIIAGLLCVMGYMLTRWVTNIGQVHEWAAAAAISFRRNDELYEEIAAMKAEGCRAMGALENIFNGVTAGGMPHSALVRKIADVATDALILCAPCDHKALALDNEGRIEHAIIRAESWEKIADRLADENIVARRNLENLQLVQQETERLLGLVQEKLVVSESDVQRMVEHNSEQGPWPDLSMGYDEGEREHS